MDFYSNNETLNKVFYRNFFILYALWQHYNVFFYVFYSNNVKLWIIERLPNYATFLF